MKGKLFAFEGIDGSGKTTQVQILADRLSKLSFSVMINKAIRDEMEAGKQLLHTFSDFFAFRKDSIAMMFLFQALHSKQYEKAKEALERKYIVLADRWNTSFWIYHQNFGPLKESEKTLKILDKLAFQGLMPNVTFLLDLPVEIALERKRLQRRKVVDIFEQEKVEVFEKAREAYLEIANSKRNWVVIDATKTISEVHRQIWEVIQKELNLGQE